MTKRSKTPRKRKRNISTKKLALISISIAITIILAVFAIHHLFLSKSDVFSLNAVIVDQLAKTNPHPPFIDNATTLLKSYGFNVEYYCNDTIDVNFFKSLAERRYGIIILRVHSALRKGGSTVDLFTNEKWDRNKYGQELKDGLIVYGNYSGDPNYYCAVTYRFIKSLDGFPKSIIFAMGCWSLKEGCEELAQAFIDRGAKAYIGWTDEILPPHTDAETLNLLEMLLNRDYPLGYAVASTKAYNYTGMLSDGTQVPITSRLRLYPDSDEVRSLRLSQLINEAKAVSKQSLTSVFNAAVLTFQAPQINKKFHPNRRRFIAFSSV